MGDASHCIYTRHRPIYALRHCDLRPTAEKEGRGATVRILLPFSGSGGILAQQIDTLKCSSETCRRLLWRQASPRAGYDKRAVEKLGTRVYSAPDSLLTFHAA